jgi:hypothetical protein
MAIMQAPQRKLFPGSGLSSTPEDIAEASAPGQHTCPHTCSIQPQVETAASESVVGEDPPDDQSLSEQDDLFLMTILLWRRFPLCQTAQPIQPDQDDKPRMDPWCKQQRNLAS